MSRYVLIYKSNAGGFVWLHPWHGKDELIQNEVACRILADHGHHIQMLPSIPEREKELRYKFLPDVNGFKNPDIRINGNYIGDIKTPGSKSVIHKSLINRCIHACAKQKVQIAVINLSGRNYAIQDIKKGIIGALQPDRNKTIEQVWIITNQLNLFVIKREMVFDETIYIALNIL